MLIVVRLKISSFVIMLNDAAFVIALLFSVINLTLIYAGEVLLPLWRAWQGFDLLTQFLFIYSVLSIISLVIHIALIIVHWCSIYLN
jgi:hypothetical protein